MVGANTYIAMASDDYREPLYFATVLSKDEAKTKIHDRFRHTILPGEKYLNAKYLKLTRSKNPNFKQYSVLDKCVFIPPDEVFGPFVDIKSDLSLDNEIYSALVKKSQDI